MKVNGTLPDGYVQNHQGLLGLQAKNLNVLIS